MGRGLGGAAQGGTSGRAPSDASTSGGNAGNPTAGTGGTNSVGGAGGTGGTGGCNQSWLYWEAGCGDDTPSPVCSTAGSCSTLGCSCEGKVIVGCRAYDEPWAYALIFNTGGGPNPGDSCDPSAIPDAE